MFLVLSKTASSLLFRFSTIFLTLSNKILLHSMLQYIQNKTIKLLATISCICIIILNIDKLGSVISLIKLRQEKFWQKTADFMLVISVWRAMVKCCLNQTQIGCNHSYFCNLRFSLYISTKSIEWNEQGKKSFTYGFFTLYKTVIVYLSGI